MRIGFHYHTPAIFEDGQVFMPAYQGRFVDSLAKYYDEVACYLHTPLPEERDRLDYSILSPNVRLVSIGPHQSVPQRMLYFRRFMRDIPIQSTTIDLMLLRGPSPLLPAVAQAAKGVPAVLLIVGEYLAGINDLPQPAWRREIIRLWAWWNNAQQTRIARRSLTFVNCRHLYVQLRDKVPALVETRTTSLGEADFYVREKTRQKPPYHLLYTGRLVRAKGLLEIVEALSILLKSGEDVILDLVGIPVKGDPILAEIRQLVRERGIADRVRTHGYKTLGPELFSYYREADIYVTASRSAEGFPRTIWEAMAHSLPVVATRVGSVPAFVEGAAELVNPGKAGELAAAISGLLHDPQLRERLTKNGMELARQNTLDRQVEKMAMVTKAWLGGRIA